MDKKLYVLFSFCILILAGCNDLNNTITQETKYNVFYNGNGNTSGSVPYDNNLYLPGSEAIVLDKGTLQRNGFSFVNWNTNQHGNGNTYNVGEKLIISSNSITLYAVWNELGKYIVTFETFGGSTVNELVNVVHGSKLTKPTNPTKVNSAFEGWYIDEEFETEWDFQNNVVENNITLYAKWRSTLYPYEVTNISGYKVGIYLMINWTNPTDENFSHVRVILSGFEWAESMGGTDQDPGKTSYSAADFTGTEYVIIKCVDKDGNVSEGKKYYLSNVANPNVNDFNISGLGSFIYDGNPKIVSITPKIGSSQGTITVYYNGSTTPPVEVGTYNVTFDVEETTGFNAVNGISAGTLIIDNIYPVPSDFNINGLGTYHYDGNTKIVNITPKENSSQGTITVYYNGSTTAPVDENIYIVTFDVEAITGFNEAIGLTAGILIINSPFTVTFNSNGGSDIEPIIRVIHGSKIIEPSTPTRTGFIFNNWYKEATFTNIWNFSIDTVNNNTILYAKWDFIYSLGDTGPGGGKIFYRIEDGFIMEDTGEKCYYLEAAPIDMSSTLSWLSKDIFNTYITNSIGIGGGRYNTALILSYDSNASAARACNEYSGGGKNDWYLPSLFELNQLYRNRNIVGNLKSSTYWSSSQGTGGSPICVSFYDGLDGTNPTYITYYVRAIRAF